MNCEGYDILLSARLDGELTRDEEADLEAHLAQCPRCRRQAKELEELRGQTLSLTDEVPGRLKGWLADQDWAALPQDGPGEPAPADPDASPEAPDLPVPLPAVQSDAPQNPRRCKLPWLLCGAAAVLLLAVGLCQILFPNTMGGGFSQAMLEVFHQQEATMADREEAAQEDADQTIPDGQQESTPETEDKTDPSDSQDPSGNPNTPGDNHTTSPDQGQDPGSNDTTGPGQDDPGSNDTPDQNDPGQDDPGSNGQDPDDPPPSNGLTQQQAQDLLTAHLTGQGRSLTLLPLGSSGGMWRFSGKDDTGRVVSFFLVSQTTGQIQEVPVPPPEEGPTTGPGGLS
ncbi:MAG TPA: zf-HC2 domain-containing protein [Candidatus Evtepia faecigallinarum]|nr:zf-HC2 domain-containing protein [Candidatus Evtepia faecigallinarum]